MYIFIDEAGNFVVPSRPNLVSCVAALVIPESFAGTLFRRFRATTKAWRANAREIKGSQLDENQMATVLRLLRRFDVLLLASCIDMGLHTDAGIQAHKIGQADRFVKDITADTAPEMKRDLEDLAARTRALSNQLYVQAATLTEVVNRVIHASTLYYAQRIPSTLGNFRWRLDAKDIVVTEYEELWKEIVSPFLQAMSLREPIVQLIEADYSAFAKYETMSSEVPDHLRPHVPPEASRIPPIDVKLLMRDDLRFSPSDRYTGLQMVDIVASAIRRACNGTLRPQGWTGVGRLMPQAEKGKNCLRFISLERLERSDEKLPYNDFVKGCDKECKRMMTRGSD